MARCRKSRLLVRFFGCFEKRPSLKHSIGGWLDSARRPVASNLGYVFWGTPECPKYPSVGTARADRANRGPNCSIYPTILGTKIATQRPVPFPSWSRTPYSRGSVACYTDRCIAFHLLRARPWRSAANVRVVDASSRPLRSWWVGRSSAPSARRSAEPWTSAAEKMQENSPSDRHGGARC